MPPSLRNILRLDFLITTFQTPASCSILHASVFCSPPLTPLNLFSLLTLLTPLDLSSLLTLLSPLSPLSPHPTCPIDDRREKSPYTDTTHILHLRHLQQTKQCHLATCAHPSSVADKGNVQVLSVFQIKVSSSFSRSRSPLPPANTFVVIVASKPDRTRLKAVEPVLPPLLLSLLSPRQTGRNGKQWNQPSHHSLSRHIPLLFSAGQGVPKQAMPLTFSASAPQPIPAVLLRLHREMTVDYLQQNKKR